MYSSLAAPKYMAMLFLCQASLLNNSLYCDHGICNVFFGAECEEILLTRIIRPAFDDCDTFLPRIDTAVFNVHIYAGF
jgi:hypothetical protein